jgi:hypothetical protein
MLCCLKVLSGEMDLAEIRLIRLVIIKERETHRRFLEKFALLHPLKAL